MLSRIGRRLDRHLGPGINGFRKEVGLPPVKRIVAEWWHSPLGVIGLWPEFFAAPQIDWPRQTVLTGFPLWDEAGVTGISNEMEKFLSAGPPPVAFTPGSAMMHGEKFFENAIKACQMADVRGILLTRHTRHIPKNLPSNMAHFEYAPIQPAFAAAAQCRCITAALAQPLSRWRAVGRRLSRHFHSISLIMLSGAKRSGLLIL